ncbi:MAG: alanine racemase [candidate division WOR-3 bacterium]|nr:alanine racemase [candidate division WOR-3 bacterium]MCX7757013.1 alanine racemase [candidate division WOR-3 bacterium]MDW7987317.1 alanine racemase [candidate division WOR-3 bacterium]
MNFGRTWAEIDLDALYANLKAVKMLLGNKKILLAVKADAYGHGAKEVAWALQDEVDMLGVAGVEEGISLRYSGIKTPILILSPISYFEIDALWEYDLIPTISEMEFAYELYLSAKKRNAYIHAHIEVDTGMGRTGLDYDKALEQIQEIIDYRLIIIDGIFTHFPSADLDYEFTKIQIGKFTNLCEKLREIGLKNFIRHASNSAGFINFPAADFDMIRPGLIIYGIYPNGHSLTERSISLKPVMSLRTRIVNLRFIPQGYSISYQRKYFTSRDSIIGVISIGYGDGLPYNLKNGEVIVHCADGEKFIPQKARIVGNICMDLTMIDVTELKGVKIGLPVTVIGRADDKAIYVDELADKANTIPYEIITRISPRVPRVFIKDNKIVSIRNLLKMTNNTGNKLP